MVVVQIVMNGRRMEVSRAANSTASDSSMPLDWKATLVVSKVIDIVLGSLLFKLF